jgi:hypothetical protein
MIPAALQRAALLAAARPAAAALAPASQQQFSTDTKRLNLCNAINDALHVAMETNDRRVWPRAPCCGRLGGWLGAACAEAGARSATAALPYCSA